MHIKYKNKRTKLSFIIINLSKSTRLNSIIKNITLTFLINMFYIVFFFIKYSRN